MNQYNILILNINLSTYLEIYMYKLVLVKTLANSV